jgi:hypothetical protein
MGVNSSGCFAYGIENPIFRIIFSEKSREKISAKLKPKAVV